MGSRIPPVSTRRMNSRSAPAHFSCFFFFFQAEDGIRDLTVDWSSDVCSSDLLVRLFVGLALGQFYMPDVFLVLQAEYTDLIGFRGADVADPHHAKLLFAP